MFTRLLLGRRLANREREERRIGAFEGVPAMGLDGLASSAYGPEAALSILAPLGAVGLVLLGPVMAVILALLAILYLSYRQTIAAYPTNGGAYAVAKANLGVGASLLAAAALMIDYVLNVAVGISAGVAALVSSVPALHPYIIELCLGILALVAVANLRGTVDAGRLFAAPTYIFVASFAALLAIGLARTVLADGDPVPVVAPPPLGPVAAAAGLWLLLHAFASGCTAMTGVEAVSNGVSAFREPAVRHARRTLTAIVAILALLLGGIALLARGYHIGAMDQTQAGYQSLLSQLTAAVAGRGVFYYVAMASLLCVLVLSANTSFTGFPRLCQSIAADGFLPRPFAAVGRRLVFSVGIFYLAATASLLLLLFGGITDRLIPLFAVGAFLTFTLSQSGMVVHWLRALRDPDQTAEARRNRLRLAINAVGAAATGLALIVILVAKFTDGAWITVLIIPGVILLLTRIRRYYDRLEARLEDPGPICLGRAKPPVAVVPIEEWNRLSHRTLAFAMSLSPDVIAVHCIAPEGGEADRNEQALRARWSSDVERRCRQLGLHAPKLVLLQTPYRRLHAPLFQLLERIEAEQPRRSIAIVIPELVKQSWWQQMLHTHRASRLRRALMRYGGSRLVVVNVPGYLEEPHLDEALDREELGARRPVEA